MKQVGYAPLLPLIRMEDSQIVRMVGVEEYPYIRKWFSGYEYRLTISVEGSKGVLRFQSLDGREKVTEHLHRASYIFI